MEEIKIIVADKIASVEGTPIIICGNSDYVVNFTFDDEWADKNKKTAHFVYYQDGLKKNIPVEFEGNTCNVPVLVNTEQVSIGVSASGVVTTTGADVRCKKSILCEVDKEEQDLFEMGKKSVPNMLEYASKLNYAYQKSVFPDNYELKIDVPYITDLLGMLQDASGITKLTLKGNNNGSALNFLQFVRGCPSIVEIDLTNFIVKPNNINLMCSNAKALKTIKGEIDLTECTNTASAFVYCSALEEIRFKENSIKLSINFASSTILSSESVQSIIDGLADLTGADAQTLTVAGAILSSLTDEQMTTILNKNWVVQ